MYDRYIASMTFVYEHSSLSTRWLTIDFILATFEYNFNMLFSSLLSLFISPSDPSWSHYKPIQHG